MVRLELRELTDEKVVYAYFPENKLDHPGLVGLNRRTGKPLYIQDADCDPIKIYASQAFMRIQDYEKADDFKEIGAVCFY